MAEGVAGALLKSGAAFAKGIRSPSTELYRRICKEVPRILTIYDVDMEPKVARARVAELFRKNANVQDERVVRVLVSKGYMELEETMLQYKQTTHLMRLLDPRTVRYRVQALNPDPRSREDRNEYFRRAIDLPPRS